MLSAVSMSGSYLWRAVAIAAAVIFGIALSWWMFRRWWRRRYAEPEPKGEVWTLQQLRDLKVQGQITDAEFARLKAAMISGVRSGESTTPTKPG